MEYSLKECQSDWSNQIIEGIFEKIEYQIHIHNDVCTVKESRGQPINGAL